jgi:hypothetical protein
LSSWARTNTGDFLHAVRHLQVEDPATLERIAELLGLRLAAAVDLPPLPDRPKEPSLPKVSPEHRPAERETNAETDFLTGDNEAWVEPLTLAPAASLPAWFSNVPAYPPTGSAQGLPELPQIPLLRPLWVRAILIEALARDSDDGDLDLDLLAEQLGSGEPLRRLPRLVRKRLHKRIFVLVDTQEAMAPYREDQRQLLTAINSLLPRDLVDVVESDGCPAAGFESRQMAAELTLPSRGTTVLLLSDLGAGAKPFPAARMPDAAWRGFIKLLRRRQCPVVAFVPCDPHRVRRNGSPRRGAGVRPASSWQSP